MVLLVGLLKADQWDQVLRFSCELGVDQIVPVICERSVPRPDDWHRKVQRYRRILLESTRQCGPFVTHHRGSGLPAGAGPIGATGAEAGGLPCRWGGAHWGGGSLR